MTSHAAEIATVRAAFVDARIRATNAREDLAIDRAQAEASAIEAAGGEKNLGSNAEARERALTLALSQNPHYQARLMKCRKLEEAAATLEASLEAAKDLRREWEWSLKARMIDVLDRVGIHQSDNGHNGAADDTAFDDAMDTSVGSRTAAQLASRAAEAGATFASAAATEPEVDPLDLPF